MPPSSRSWPSCSMRSTIRAPRSITSGSRRKASPSASAPRPTTSAGSCRGWARRASPSTRFRPPAGSSWLGAQGFSIDELPAGGRTIVFSGSAGQVQEAFHTAIHRYRVHGEMHLANAGDPRIPEALAGVVAGVATLHDFRRQPMHSHLQAAPQYSAGGSYYYLAPGDFAAIYDVASLYANGINGAGQT